MNAILSFLLGLVETGAIELINSGKASDAQKAQEAALIGVLNTLLTPTPATTAAAAAQAPAKAAPASISTSSDPLQAVPADNSASIGG